MNGSAEKKQIPVAIIGMACRLPGADNLEQYWKMLVEGRCAVADVPPDRFDQELYYDPRKGVRNKSYSRRGAVVSDRRFDHQGCPISQDLVRGADITHLLMCQVAAEAFRHAGMDPMNPPLRNTSVYVGHTVGSGLDGDYTYALGIEEAAEFLRDVDLFRDMPLSWQQATIRDLVNTVRGSFPRRTGDDPDLASHMAAGIISKAFGLDGPFMAVNSACASSSQAILFAVRALQVGRIDMAVVGGASVCKSNWLVLFSQAHSLSASESRPFDQRADGLICSEGYVALVLKTLDRALADGDPIQAVIRGLGVSSDGRGRALWAPREEGQVEAMRRAYEAGVEMADLQYIEAHSTATQLGDATEIAAISKVLQGVLPNGRTIPITSVKANIGHALEAAGIAGVIKAVLCMQKGLIPPAINIQTLNPKIPWADAPVYIPRQTIPWPASVNGKPRRAGVNAFGVGGPNVHVVIDSYTNPAKAGTPRKDATRSPRSPRPPHPDDCAIAVVGAGCVFPGAGDVKSFRDLLFSQRDPKQVAPPDRWRTDLAYRPGERRPFVSPTLFGGFVTDFDPDWRSCKLPPKQIARADPLQFMVLHAADQALADSGYDRKPFDRRRTGVLVGTEFRGDFTDQLELALRLPHIGKIIRESLVQRGCSVERAEEIEEKFRDSLFAKWPALLDETGSFSSSSLAARIAKSWDVMGGSAAIDSGATSGMSALSAAADLLAAGDCGMMVCAAGQRHMGLAAYEALSMAGVLAHDCAAPGPFDGKASGYFPGEGAGVLLLKRLRDAQRDGDRIRCIIRNVAAAHGDHLESLSRAIHRSLQPTGLAACDLAMVMTDASGLPDADEATARAVLACQANVQRSEPLLLGSVVGQIGHTGGASALASLIAASLALETRKMPGVFGLNTPRPSLAAGGHLVRSGNRAAAILHRTLEGRQVGAVLSYDKGLAYCAVVERPVSVGQTPPNFHGVVEFNGTKQRRAKMCVMAAADQSLHKTRRNC